MMPRLRRTARRAGLLALVALLLPLAGPRAAGATPLEDARSRAKVLRAAIDKLELDAAMAIEDYDAVQDSLARALNAHVTAQQELDAARAAAETAGTISADRVRSLYMSGGAVALYASVLQASDISDVFSRVANVSAVVGSDARSRGNADTALAAVAAAEKRLDAAAGEQLKLEKRARDTALKVEAALAKQTELLAAADAQVVRLAEEERRRAEEAAAREFARRMAQARGVTQVPGNVLELLKNDPTTAPSPAIATAIAAAKAELGKPYQWGAVGPDSYDCSGLTGWAYRKAGVNLPRTSRQQWYAGTHPDLAELLPGDLLFWGPDRSNVQSIHHVALYIGGGRMIAAPRTGTTVRIQPVYYGDFFGVTRPVSAGSVATPPG